MITAGVVKKVIRMINQTGRIHDPMLTQDRRQNKVGGKPAWIYF